MAWMSEVRPPPGNFLSSGLLRSPATFANIKSSGIPRVRCYFSNYRGDLPDAPPLRSSNFSVVPRGSLGGLLLPNLVAKVFGPINFEASKLEVMFLGVEKDEHPELRPRVYTLTHCDLTASLLLTISTSINTDQLQGWYKRLQRDDVVAVWRRCQGSMFLQVHCHISGDHWFRDAFAELRFHIFKRELPLVFKAFQHGDRLLFQKQSDLENAPVWVHFHSNVKEFDRVEYWGPLTQGGQFGGQCVVHNCGHQEPIQCRAPCQCCSDGAFIMNDSQIS